MTIPVKIAAVFAVLAGYAAFSAEPSNTEQTQDLVRVVVVSLSKINMSSGQAESNAQSVPGLKMVYIVEALGNAPLQNWDLGHWGLTVDGKPVCRSKKSSDEGLIVASDYTKYDWKKLKKPTVSDPGRVVVYDHSMPYFQLPKGKTDLRIETGFNLSTRSFVFKDVTVE